MMDREAQRLSRDAQLARIEEAKKRYPAIYTIYDHPRDMPNAIVVRLWYGLVGHPDVFLTQFLESARAYCNDHGACVCLPRQPADDPAIIESWI